MVTTTLTEVLGAWRGSLTDEKSSVTTFQRPLSTFAKRRENGRGVKRPVAHRSIWNVFCHRADRYPPPELVKVVATTIPSVGRSQQTTT